MNNSYPPSSKSPSALHMSNLITQSRNTRETTETETISNGQNSPKVPLTLSMGISDRLMEGAVGYKAKSMAKK